MDLCVCRLSEELPLITGEVVDVGAGEIRIDVDDVFGGPQNGFSVLRVGDRVGGNVVSSYADVDVAEIEVGDRIAGYFRHRSGPLACSAYAKCVTNDCGEPDGSAQWMRCDMLCVQNNALSCVETRFEEMTQGTFEWLPPELIDATDSGSETMYDAQFMARIAEPTTCYTELGGEELDCEPAEGCTMAAATTSDRGLPLIMWALLPLAVAWRRK